MNDYIENLVKEAKLGNSNDKEELVNRFKPFIVKRAQGVFIKNYDMEDLIQIGVMSILRAIESYKLERKNFVSYVTYAITNNFNYEIRKRNKDRFESSLNKETDEGLEILDLVSDEGNIEENYINKEMRDKLLKSINMLSLEEKSLIQMVYFEKIKIKDYAESKGIKYGTVMKRKRVVMEKLRMHLEREIKKEQ